MERRQVCGNPAETTDSAESSPYQPEAPARVVLNGKATGVWKPSRNHRQRGKFPLPARSASEGRSGWAEWKGDRCVETQPKPPTARKVPPTSPKRQRGSFRMGCTTSGDPRWRVGLVRPRWGQ